MIYLKSGRKRLPGNLWSVIESFQKVSKNRAKFYIEYTAMVFDM